MNFTALVDALRPLARDGLRSGVILVAALLAAWLLGRLAAAWARSANGGDGELVRSVRRYVPLLVVLIGVYLAVTDFPLGPRALKIVGAATYIAATLVGVRLGIRVVVALLGRYFAHRTDGEERQRAEREYVPLAGTLATAAFGLMGFITVANHLGYQVSSLVAALGVGSLAIGLAAQQTLGNMIAGFTLMVDRPFRPGDRVRLASGEVGKVADIGIRSTRIHLAEGNMLVVPNTELANSRVVNYEFPSVTSRGEVRAKVKLADAARWIGALERVAVGDPAILAEPPPVVRVLTVGDEDAEVALHFLVRHHEEQLQAEDRVRRGVLREMAP